MAEEKTRRKSNRTRQKNKTGDSKVESNDSSEIPDRGETSDIPGLPFGGGGGGWGWGEVATDALANGPASGRTVNTF